MLDTTVTRLYCSPRIGAELNAEIRVEGQGRYLSSKAKELTTGLREALSRSEMHVTGFDVIGECFGDKITNYVGLPTTEIHEKFHQMVNMAGCKNTWINNYQVLEESAAHAVADYVTSNDELAERKYKASMLLLDFSFSTIAAASNGGIWDGHREDMMALLGYIPVGLYEKNWAAVLVGVERIGLYTLCREALLKYGDDGIDLLLEAVKVADKEGLMKGAEYLYGQVWEVPVNMLPSLHHTRTMHLRKHTVTYMLNADDGSFEVTLRGGTKKAKGLVKRAAKPFIDGVKWMSPVRTLG
jgi:hypothetical protein